MYTVVQVCMGHFLLFLLLVLLSLLLASSIALIEFPHSTASDSFELSGYIQNVTFFIYSVFSGSSLHFPRAPFTLLTLLSATVKIFRFKLAEKFLLEELTYQIFMMTSESRGIATCHSNIRSRQAAQACTFPREIFTHAV